MYHASVETTVRGFPRIGLNVTAGFLRDHTIVVQIHSRTAEKRGSPIDNSRPLYQYEINAGHYQKQLEEERVSCMYRPMHDRRMHQSQRGAVAVEIKRGCEGYGEMPSVAEGSCGAASGRTG
eukprot:scaffold321726_cov42-Attheya_sp.AAC.1